MTTELAEKSGENGRKKMGMRAGLFAPEGGDSVRTIFCFPFFIFRLCGR
jgi:hypothetical protein